MIIRIEDATKAITKAVEALTHKPDAQSRIVRRNRRVALRSAVKTLLRVMDRDFPNIARVELSEKTLRPHRPVRTAQAWEKKMRKADWIPLHDVNQSGVRVVVQRSMMAAGVNFKLSPYSKTEIWIPAWTLGAFDSPRVMERAKRSTQEKRSLLVVASFRGLF